MKPDQGKEAIAAVTNPQPKVAVLHQDDPKLKRFLKPGGRKPPTLGETIQAQGGPKWRQIAPDGSEHDIDLTPYEGLDQDAHVVVLTFSMPGLADLTGANAGPSGKAIAEARKRLGIT